ncbi:MAG: M28 family peptidase [Chitinophagaceae bacterium]
MLRIYFFAGMLSIAAGTTAQSKTAADYASHITEAKLREYLTVLTSDELAGRETSTPGEAKAAAYVASQFKLSGLKKFSKAKKYLQYYKVFRDSMVTETLRFGDNVYMPGVRFLMSTNASFSQHLKASELVFVGYGISDSAYDDYAGKDVKNKIVVYASGEPMNADSTWLLTGTRKGSEWIATAPNRKQQEAKARGAKAVFQFTPETATFSEQARNFSLRNALKYDPATPILNQASLSHALMDSLFGKEVFAVISDAAKKKKLLNQLEIKPVKTNIELTYKEAVEKRKARNVVGYIKGSEKPEEYVYMTAHMDHLGSNGKDIFRGADDDGSGTSAVMAMAAAFADATKDGMRPKRSIIFMTVSGEEKGLWGSDYATKNPVVDLEKVSADINTDMIGRIDPKRKEGDSLNYVYAVGSDKISTEIKPLLEQVNKQHDKVELDYKFDDPKDRERIYFRSDHYNFAKHGVPIVFFYNGSHPDYHKATDTIEKINFMLMAKRARLAFYLGWELANRENMLVRDLPVPTSTR